MKSEDLDAGLAKSVTAAEGILNGTLEMLEGCRLIADLTWDLEQRHNELFFAFIAVDSETEDLPQPRDRHLWSQEALESKDEEEARYIEKSREAIFAACRRLIEALKRPPQQLQGEHDEGPSSGP